MEKRDDLRRELDVMQFGNLIHFAVEDMGKDPGKIWACGDQDHLAAFLADRVECYCDKTFGSKPWLGITVAKESAIRRLRAFAEKQVAWHKEGWEIVETEVEKTISIIDGMTLKGRCDRIDFNSITKEYCVLDYKTGKTEMPEKKHFSRAKDEHMLFDEMRVDVMNDKGKPETKAWFGLQLPLYCAFLAAEGKTGAKIGYVSLPESAEETEFSIWKNYTAELHTSAMNCAKKVAEQICAGVFHQTGRAKYQGNFDGLLLGDSDATILPPPNPWELSE
jgi:ATP-dependent helicase/nuclease subunit B